MSISLSVGFPGITVLPAGGGAVNAGSFGSLFVRHATCGLLRKGFDLSVVLCSCCLTHSYCTCQIMCNGLLSFRWIDLVSSFRGFWFCLGFFLCIKEKAGGKEQDANSKKRGVFNAF